MVIFWFVVLQVTYMSSELLNIYDLSEQLTCLSVCLLAVLKVVSIMLNFLGLAFAYGSV